jgi:16S rRNA (adenine1518-N6/adenine1519-N6)-dimethyltransferase
LELCSAAYLKELMGRHGFSLSKSLGQNFLIDPAVPEKIAESAALDAETSVLEVGPGVGCLTRALSARAAEVFAVEIDKSLQPVLNETLAGLDNTKVIYGDILKTDIRALAAERFSFRKAVAVSNLPYYITTKTITVLLTSRVFSSVTVMLQKEAAKKLTASPSEEDWCLLSVIANHFSIPRKLFSVPAGAFYPAPKVDSVVVRLDSKASDLSGGEQDIFFSLVRAVFSNRRKTVLNNIASAYPEIGKSGAQPLLERLEISPDRRGESLTLPELYGISSELMQMLQSK